MTPLTPWERAAGLQPIDITKVHYSYIPPMSVDNKALQEKYEQMQQFAWADLKKMTNDPNKMLYTAFARISANLLENFHCDRTGQDFGPVTQFPTGTALVCDSLTGINDVSLQLTSGASVARSDAQIGGAMEAQLSLFGKKLPMDTQCMYILIAHPRMIYAAEDQVSKLRAHAIGKANAGEWPKNFSDTILCRHEGTDFWWDTSGTLLDGAVRNLPITDRLAPDFGPLLDYWLENARAQQQAAGR